MSKRLLNPSLLLALLVACDKDEAPSASVEADTVTDAGLGPTPDTTGPNSATDTNVGPGPTDTGGGTSTSDTAEPPWLDVFIPSDPSRDPCGDVPTTGRCKGRDIEACVAGTGNSERFVATRTCEAGTACAIRGGEAVCAPTGACTPYASECRGNRAAYCEAGQWVEETCSAGCRTTLVGALCKPSAPTVRYANTFAFEFRVPNDELTDWSDEVYANTGNDLLILSFQGGALIDAAVTDENGAFVIDAAATGNTDAGDFVSALLLKLEDPTRSAYGVLDPGQTGEQDVEARLESGFPDASYWGWSWGIQDIPANEGVYLPLDAGGGAAFVYNYLAVTYEYTKAYFGARPASSLSVWFGLGTSWSCGACFITWPNEFNGDRFDSQVFIPGDDDEGYWSGAVLAHEFGHWTMATYGVSPGEGGTHILGVPSHPGLAWSEGFATWFSSFMREEPYYYDRQDGLFFWLDLDERVYSAGHPWNRPVASEGLEQLIDENEVASMLLALTTPSNGEALMLTLASPRMTVAPFLRGYTTRDWDDLNEDYLPLPAWSTGESAPHFADFLDALVCGGTVAANGVNSVTEPALHYPYPSASPLCRSARAPIAVTFEDSPAGVVAVVRWHIPLEAPLSLGFVPGNSPVEIPAGSPPGELRLVYQASSLSGTVAPMKAAPDGLAVHLDGPHLRVHGTVPYRPREVVPPARTGPPLNLRGLGKRGTIALKFVPESLRAPYRKLMPSR
jgi:hypothetical protein